MSEVSEGEKKTTLQKRAKPTTIHVRANPFYLHEIGGARGAFFSLFFSCADGHIELVRRANTKKKTNKKLLIKYTI